MSTDLQTDTLEVKQWKTRRKGDISIWDPRIIRGAIPDSFKKLDPRVQIKNPVMFVVEVGSVITTIEFVRLLFATPTATFTRSLLTSETIFVLAVAFWLWFTVVFANFAEAMAEGRGKAQADTLRKARSTTMAKRLASPDRFSNVQEVAAPDLRKGDLVLVEAGDVIPGDGDVQEGVASVDESAITGESAPVIRESGGDRSAVTGGTRVLSDWIVVRISANPGETFLDRMIALVEGAKRQRTPNEIALNILIASLTIIFVLVVVSLEPFAIYSGAPVSVTTLIALLVCLIPTTIGGLLSAIGIAGMDRLVQRNVLAMSGRAVEAAGDVDVLLLDKTGTITLGNRQATRFVPLRGVDEPAVARAAMPSSLADETPEGYLAFTSKIIRWLKYGQEASKHQEAALHRLEEHALLAEDLGAEVIRTKSKDIARTLVEIAQKHQVTQIVLGQPARSHWEELIRGSIINRLLRFRTDINIHLVPLFQDEEE